MKKEIKRKVSIVEDVDGTKTVVIHDVKFKGRNRIDWTEIEKYLKQYIGEFYTVIEYNDKIYIGRDLPDEYTSSNYNKSLRRNIAKAKANSIVGIPEMINIALDKHHTENHKEKHNNRAKFGWYKYKTRFALPSYSNTGDLEYYNVWTASLIVNETVSGKKYLYDIIEFNKEVSKPR